MRASVWYEHAVPKCIESSTSEREHRAPAEQHDRSGERVVGAAANSASIMRELNPVPFEQWHGPWSDCRQRRPVPSARGVKAVLGFVTLLSTVEMELACRRGTRVP